jgi:hypothetical protein
VHLVQLPPARRQAGCSPGYGIGPEDMEQQRLLLGQALFCRAATCKERQTMSTARPASLRAAMSSCARPASANA